MEGHGNEQSLMYSAMEVRVNVEVASENLHLRGSAQTTMPMMLPFPHPPPPGVPHAPSNFGLGTSYVNQPFPMQQVMTQMMCMDTIGHQYQYQYYCSHNNFLQMVPPSNFDHTIGHPPVYGGTPVNLLAGGNNLFFPMTGGDATNVIQPLPQAHQAYHEAPENPSLGLSTGGNWEQPVGHFFVPFQEYLPPSYSYQMGNQPPPTNSWQLQQPPASSDLMTTTNINATCNGTDSDLAEQFGASNLLQQVERIVNENWEMTPTGSQHVVDAQTQEQEHSSLASTVLGVRKSSTQSIETSDPSEQWTMSPPVHEIVIENSDQMSTGSPHAVHTQETGNSPSASTVLTAGESPTKISDPSEQWTMSSPVHEIIIENSDQTSTASPHAVHTEEIGNSSAGSTVLMTGKSPTPSSVLATRWHPNRKTASITAEKPESALASDAGNDKPQPLGVYQVKERIHEHFLKSGQRDLLMAHLRRRAARDGWTETVRDAIVERIRERGPDNVNVSHMLADLAPLGRKLFPEELRKELEKTIFEAAKGHFTIDDTVAPITDPDDPHSEPEKMFLFQSRDVKPDLGLGIGVEIPAAAPRPLTPEPLPPPPVLKPETLSTSQSSPMTAAEKEDQGEDKDVRNTRKVAKTRITKDWKRAISSSYGWMDV